MTKLISTVLEISEKDIDSRKGVEQICDTFDAHIVSDSNGINQFLQRFNLQLRYCLVSNQTSFDEAKADLLTEINVLALNIKYSFIKSQTQKIVKLLCYDLIEFELTLDNLTFQDHINAIRKIGNHLNMNSKLNDKQCKLHETISPKMKNQYLFYFNYLDTILIPFCKFYQMHEQHIGCTLMKFGYMVLGCYTSSMDFNNLACHLAELADIYYKHSKGSMIMQQNYLSCKQFLKNFLNKDDRKFSPNLGTLDCLVNIDYEEIINHDTYDSLCQFIDTIHERKNEGNHNTNEYLLLSKANKIKSRFDGLIPTDKWVEHKDIDIGYHTGYNQIIVAVGAYEGIIEYLLNSKVFK